MSPDAFEKWKAALRVQWEASVVTHRPESARPSEFTPPPWDTYAIAQRPEFAPPPKDPVVVTDLPSPCVGHSAAPPVASPEVAISIASQAWRRNPPVNPRGRRGPR